MAAWPQTTFRPSRHGFHFVNNFVVPISVFGVNVGAGNGLCGGMAYGALDYFYQGMPVPTCIGTDFGSWNAVPPFGTPLADYLLQRELDTFYRYYPTLVRWGLTPDDSTLFTGDGIIKATKQHEWPKLQAYLDRGAPTAICVIPADEGPGNKHELVAYSYYVIGNSITIWVYDCNYPGANNQTIASTIDNTTPHWFESPTNEEYRGFFVQDGGNTSAYSEAPISSPVGPHIPPPPGNVVPPVVDFVIKNGPNLNPTPPLLGKSLDCSFSGSNSGAYPAHAQSLYLLVSSAMPDAGAAFTSVLGPDTAGPWNLQPGDPFAMDKLVADLSVPDGAYTIFAGYTNLDSDFIPLKQVQVQVYRGPYLDLGIVAEVPALVPPNLYYEMIFSAIPHPSIFKPTQYQWLIDEGTPYQQSAVGNPTPTIKLRVFESSGGPFANYVHVAKVTASDLAGLSAQASLTLDLTPSGGLAPDYADSNSKIAAKGGQSTTLLSCAVTAYSQVLVRARTSHLLKGAKYVWSPTSASLLGDGSSAIIPSILNGDPSRPDSYSGQNVTCDVTDAAGQTLHLQAFIDAHTYQYGYKPISTLNFLFNVPIDIPIEIPFGSLVDPLTSYSPQYLTSAAGISYLSSLPQTMVSLGLSESHDDLRAGGMMRRKRTA